MVGGHPTSAGRGEPSALGLPHRGIGAVKPAAIVHLARQCYGSVAAFFPRSVQDLAAARSAPSLDIPVFDPTRNATLASRRGQTDEACAQYRAALVQIVGDVDSAYVNLASRDRQLKSVCDEVTALAQARNFISANFRAGLVSQVEVFESERSYFQASRSKAVLKGTLLQDHVTLIRALGGGCDEVQALPVITAEPVIKPTPLESLLSVKHPDKRWFRARKEKD